MAPYGQRNSEKLTLPLKGLVNITFIPYMQLNRTDLKRFRIVTAFMPADMRDGLIDIHFQYTPPSLQPIFLLQTFLFLRIYDTLTFSARETVGRYSQHHMQSQPNLSAILYS